jgi:beta-lactamase regulating signal transducer with metallopeptidase domain
MSTEFATVGSFCQAAIVTFQPVSLATQLLVQFMIIFALIKLTASIAKAFITFKSLSLSNHLPLVAKKLATKYGLAHTHLFIIKESNLIAFSSTIPFISNGLYLSEGMFRVLSKKQQEAVFLHELYHWKHKDPLQQLLFNIIGEVCFFLPSVKDLMNHWQLKAELAADAFAIKNQGSALPIKQALAKWLNYSSIQPMPNWSMSFAEIQLDTRITVLNRQPLPAFANWSVGKSSALLVARLAITVCVIASFSMLKASQYAQAQAQLVIPTSPQCTQDWQNQTPESSIFTIMSHQ